MIPTAAQQAEIHKLRRQAKLSRGRLAWLAGVGSTWATAAEKGREMPVEKFKRVLRAVRNPAAAERRREAEDGMTRRDKLEDAPDLLAMLERFRGAPSSPRGRGSSLSAIGQGPPG
ncbi:MAG: hypothetical protein GY719_26290 [bacterium]|nr:hypothetical protein [bacterium]